MATPTKAANGTTRNVAPSSTTVSTVDLSTFVRDNAPRIVSALDCAAQYASVAGNWSERQAYLTISEGIIMQTGLYTPAVMGSPPLARGASVGGT